MANDIIITPASGEIEFYTISGSTIGGKIEQSGDDLVLSNAVGDVLLGDGTSDVYIGDGTANVDIIFEQNGSIKGEPAAGVTLTLGSNDTTLYLTGSTLALQKDGGNVGIGTTSPSEKLTVEGNISASGTGSMPYLMLGGATSLTEANTRLEVTGQINVGGNGDSGTVRAYRGKFSRINNRTSGNDIIEFSSNNNVNILGPITASSDISASGQFMGANFGLDSTDKLQFSPSTL